jgi:hypothetical protein
MLEKELVQHRGFRNVIKNEEVIGFQVAVRQMGYRGTWLSQLRSHAVIVDGVEYGNDVLTWTISGIEYTVDEMKTLGRIMWQLNETAVITVKKPGGLSQGEHEVDVIYGHIASYLPPRLDNMYKDTARRHSNARKLIIV